MNLRKNLSSSAHVFQTISRKVAYVSLGIMTAMIFWDWLVREANAVAEEGNSTDLIMSNNTQMITQILTVAALQTVALVPYNQSPLKEKYHAFTSICYPEDELEIHYDIIKNVHSLRDVTRFIFNEWHTTLFHHQLNSYFVKSLGSKNDILLFEGVSSNRTTPCSAVCYDQTGTLLTSNIEYNPKLHRVCDGVPGRMSFNISDEFICRGWDDVEIQKKHTKDLMVPQKALVRLNTLVLEFNQLYKRMHALQENITKMQMDLALKEIELCRIALLTLIQSEITQKYLADFANKKLTFINSKTNLSNSQNIYESLLHITVEFSEAISKKNKYYENKIDKSLDPLVKTRNKAAKQAFQYLRNHTGRIFSFFGQLHLTSMSTAQSKNYFLIEKDDPQFELRKYLGSEPHAILIPKIKR